MFYLTTHSTHFIYGYMASDIWLRTILIVRKETRCHHIGYSFRLTARFFLYAPSHRQDSTYHGLCYTSRGALAGTRNRLYGVRHMVKVSFLMNPQALLPEVYSFSTLFMPHPATTLDFLDAWSRDGHSLKVDGKSLSLIDRVKGIVSLYYLDGLDGVSLHKTFLTSRQKIQEFYSIQKGYCAQKYTQNKFS